MAPIATTTEINSIKPIKIIKTKISLKDGTIQTTINRTNHWQGISDPLLTKQDTPNIISINKNK
jgi:hypothetical protein